MDFALIYTKDKQFVEKSIGEEKVLVPLSDNVADMNHVFTLNEVGTFVYDEIDGKKSIGEIFKDLLNEYDVEEEVALTDLQQFLKEAIDKGILKKK